MADIEAEVASLARLSSDPAHVWHELTHDAQSQVVAALALVIASKRAATMLPEADRQERQAVEELKHLEPQLPGLQERLEAACQQYETLRRQHDTTQFYDNRQEALERQLNAASRERQRAETDVNITTNEIRRWREQQARMTRLKRALASAPAPRRDVLADLQRELAGAAGRSR